MKDQQSGFREDKERNLTTYETSPSVSGCGVEEQSSPEMWNHKHH